MRKNDLDERKIVADILQGNEASLRLFYRSFHKPLYSFISKRIDNDSDAEEILQDTLISTIEALRDFSFQSRLFTFICAIAKHKVVDFYRKKKIKSIILSKIADFEPLVSTLLGPEDKLDEALLRQKIRQTFSAITPQYQIILKLKYEQGYSVIEIAEKLSITFKSAESLLFRARKAFARAYQT
ncbi:sigma-70 family RNA polymerase sigma factor [Candidatus Gottesmanbacteria bacterium]|nr:sigma-70 family RNA polymerase sigma factor [Candidatus Gottesmanbacteria bacterium]